MMGVVRDYFAQPLSVRNFLHQHLHPDLQSPTEDPAALFEPLVEGMLNVSVAQRLAASDLCSLLLQGQNGIVT